MATTDGGAAAVATVSERFAKPPEETTVHEAIRRIIAEMPAVPKSHENKQQGFRFRSIDDAIAALRPLLAKHGVHYAPLVEERIAESRETARGGTLWTVHLRVRVVVWGPGGDSIEAVTWGEGTDSGDKATGKALTAALKQAIFALFAVGDRTDDPDASSAPPTRARKRAAGPEEKPGKATRAQAARLANLCKELGIDPKEWLARRDVGTFVGEVDEADAEALIEEAAEEVRGANAREPKPEAPEAPEVPEDEQW